MMRPVRDVNEQICSLLNLCASHYIVPTLRHNLQESSGTVCKTQHSNFSTLPWFNYIDRAPVVKERKEWMKRGRGVTDWGKKIKSKVSEFHLKMQMDNTISIYLDLNSAVAQRTPHIEWTCDEHFHWAIFFHQTFKIVLINFLLILILQAEY